jgi:CheY-like chemotaxis protein
VPITILIVDDHPSFRASARAILEADGFDVVGEVESGVGALTAVTEKRPDVLLLDVQLPDMSGFDVCSTIVARHNGSAPQIVLVTGRDACDFGSRSGRAGPLHRKADLSARQSQRRCGEITGSARRGGCSSKQRRLRSSSEERNDDL